MTRALLLAYGLLVASGCALRPRYAELVLPTTPGPEATFLLTERSSGQPLGGAHVELGEGASRVVTTTLADGTFSLPVDGKRFTTNPVLVVTLPPGVQGYRVTPAPPPAPVTPVAPIAPIAPVAPVAPAEAPLASEPPASPTQE